MMNTLFFLVKRNTCCALFLYAWLGFSQLTGAATTGDPDPSFGSQGNFHFNGNAKKVQGIVSEPQGTLLSAVLEYVTVGGNTTFSTVLIRTNLAGSEVKRWTLPSDNYTDTSPISLKRFNGKTYLFVGRRNTAIQPYSYTLYEVDATDSFISRFSYTAQSESVRDFAVAADESSFLAIQAPGANNTSDFKVIHFLANGNVDFSWANNMGGAYVEDWLGKQNIPVAITLDSVGRIIVAGTVETNGGTTAMAALRLLPNGTPDQSFSTAAGGRLYQPFDYYDNNLNQYVKFNYNVGRILVDPRDDIFLIGSYLINGRLQGAVQKIRGVSGLPDNSTIGQGNMDNDNTAFGNAFGGGSYFVLMQGDQSLVHGAFFSNQLIGLLGVNVNNNIYTPFIIRISSANGSLDSSFGVAGRYVYFDPNSTRPSVLTKDQAGRFVFGANESTPPSIAITNARLTAIYDDRIFFSDFEILPTQQ